jgi:3-hydroxymyristoyl/3-hydroxydecanoyl-(acyl carrier protein) dehydratase
VWHERAAGIPANHPCLAGHFPGNPIIPGTLLLQRIIELLVQRYPGFQVTEVINAKFMHPLLPEQSFDIRGEEKSGRISFECLVEDTPIASGKLALTKIGSHP